MKEALESLEARNRVLGSWTKEKYDLKRITGLWDKLIHLMDNYQRIIGMKVLLLSYFGTTILSFSYLLNFVFEFRWRT